MCGGFGSFYFQREDFSQYQQFKENLSSMAVGTLVAVVVLWSGGHTLAIDHGNVLSLPHT